VAPPGNQAVNRENKRQPEATGVLGLLDRDLRILEPTFLKIPSESRPTRKKLFDMSGPKPSEFRPGLEDVSHAECRSSVWPQHR
jgi:hypothetical protein